MGPHPRSGKSCTGRLSRAGPAGHGGGRPRPPGNGTRRGWACGVVEVVPGSDVTAIACAARRATVGGILNDVSEACAVCVRDAQDPEGG